MEFKKKIKIQVLDLETIVSEKPMIHLKER